MSEKIELPWEKIEKAKEALKASFWGDFLFGGLVVSGLFIFIESLELPSSVNSSIGISLFIFALFLIFLRIIYMQIGTDRLLTKKVQQFYKNIENLIFFYYLDKRVDHLSKAGPISYRQALLSSGAGIHSPLQKMLEYFSNELSDYQAKVRKEFLASSKQFGGLPKCLDLYSEGDKGNKIQYMNKTDFILYENGNLKNQLVKDVIEDHSKVNERGFRVIDDYLKSLRDSWKENHHKPFIKPVLKAGLSVSKYLKDPLLFLENQFPPPECKEDYFKIGYLLTYLREFHDAIRKFDEVLNIYPNYKEAWNIKGLALFYQENYEGALECCDKALEIDSNYKEALNNEGWILVAQGNYEDALKYLNKVIKIDPNNILALSNKGWALVAQGDCEGALKYLNKALEIDPNYIFALNNKGYALNGLKRYDEALKYCDKVLKIDPKDIFVLNSKGIALGGLKRYEETLECLDKAFEIEPNYIFALNIKGIALDGLKRYEETLEYLDKALEIDPNDIFVLNIKGITLKGRKRYEEALEYLDKALEIDPKYAITWYNKARLESLRNNLKESIKSLKNAIELDNSLWGKAMGEHEFDNIRDTPEFRKLIWDE